MVKAYVLIVNEPGAEDSIISNLSKISSITDAHGTFGSYDIIAEVSSENAEKLREDITWKIRKLPYIRATLTLMVLE